MASMEEELTQALREQAERLRDQLAPGDTRVVEVRVRPGEASDGERAIFVELKLANPPGDLETWPVDDVWALRRTLRNAVAHLATDIPWFIVVEPEDAGELDPEDAEQQIDV
jgi:hypothetical protein